METVNFRRSLNFIYVFVLVLFALSLTYDLSITLSMVSQHPEYLKYEGNPLFVWSQSNNIPFYFSPDFLLQIGLAINLMVVKERYFRKQTKLSFIVFNGLLCGLILFSALHIMGGYSWLVI